MEKISWSYDKRGNYWCGHRLMPDGVCNFIYCIYPEGEGYTADAMNNAYGAERIAVSRKDHKSNRPSVFKDLHKLMKAIENNTIYWKYTGFCNCIGEVTREEY
jgi:hypothetical protein